MNSINSDEYAEQVTDFKSSLNQPVEHIGLLSETERQQLLVGWNAAQAEYPADQCVHELFEAQAARTPEAVAVVYESQTLSYRELNRQANRLAHHLVSLSVKPDDRVAICVERGLEMVVGILAVLKAGGAYVPLDPVYPAERLAYMLGDSTPVAVLTTAKGRAALAEHAVPAPLIDLQRDVEQWRQCSPDNLDARVLGLEARHLAYIIYTSGSTGAPKGVMIEHRNTVNFLSWAQQSSDAAALSKTLFSTSLNFDLAVYECFAPLTTGGRIEVVANALALQEGKHDIHLINTVPSALQALLEARAISEHVEVVNVAGEVLKRELVERLFAETQVVKICNLYGPTETTTYSSWVTMNRETGFIPSIGRPIFNTQIYILDAEQEPVSVGVAGELYIGGAGVARGYLNRAELTAERFVADPFAGKAGARMYKTGDLGRWQADGGIEYLGRNDQQVKIRGFRVELGEIEACLGAHEGVGEAVVVAREDEPGDKRLVAYVTAAARPDGRKAELELEGLRTHLSASLPEYMVPAAYVVLERLPLTPNGKLDRKALPAPEGDAYVTRGYVAPVGEVENRLARIWAEVLKLERVGRYDNFFELGGHSLLAVTLLSRLRQVLGIDVSLKDLFAHAQLAGFAEALKGAGRSEQMPLTAVSREEELPLSYAQQRLWFLGQMEGGSEAYHVPQGLRLKGRLERGALKKALERIVWRHEALRTSFARVGEQTVQRIAAPDSGFALQEEDLRGQAEMAAELTRRMGEEASRPFDLEHGPLLRGLLLRLAEEEHVLVITIHHIVYDGWSIGVLTKELSALYRAYSRGGEDPLPRLAIQYADYAVWQRRWLSGEVLERQSGYWRERLAGAPALLELPLDRPRPARQSFSGERVGVELNGDLTRRLKALSQRHGMTLYMTVLAGWAAVLARLSGQAEVVIGTPIANRTRAELEGLIGYFVNTQALRVAVSGTVAELLEQVKGHALGAQDHQDLPFEQVVELVKAPRSLSYTPVFQAMLAWQNTDDGRLDLPGLTVSPVDVEYGVAKFDVELELREGGDCITGGLVYATALFKRSTIERHVGYLRRVLEAMVADERQQVERIDLLSEAERQQLLIGWNATEAEYPQDQCVHELFEAQAARTPEAVAVVYENQTLSYRELNGQANRLAHHLVSLGVKPDDRVAICLERGLEMVVGILAILKAGGAYVPLDPVHPPERLAYMLEDVAPQVLLTREKLKGKLPRISHAVLAVDNIWRDIATYDSSNPEHRKLGLRSEHLAYVIYTSGSTGHPKGVMVEHRQLVNLVRALECGYALTEKDRLLQFAALSFDVSVEEVFGALCFGCALVLRTDEWIADAQTFWRYCSNNEITVLNLPTAFWHHLVSDRFTPIPGTIRQIIVGGEKVNPEMVARWFLRDGKLPRLINAYGPTEVTVTASLCQIVDPEMSSSLIGRPILNTQIYILDAHRRPVPIGVVGELYIGGANVARGYLNRQSQTEERFLPNPFSADVQARMYRTGDLGRFRPDGNIEFLGRNDHQVKIRGFRIELGEIETRLAEHPCVSEAVVVAREDRPGDKRLVAYVKMAESTGRSAVLDIENLRAHLSAGLPEYMVPAAFVALATFPLTPNGKLDRKALPAPDEAAYVVRDYEAPVSEVEGTLARIWAEVLHVERVGRHDNFFELGGHSLLAITLIERMRRVDLRVDVRTLFATPTLAALADSTEEIQELVL